MPTVLVWAQTAPDAADPSASPTTSATVGPSASIVMTTSAPSTASAGVAATLGAEPFRLRRGAVPGADVVAGLGQPAGDRSAHEPGPRGRRSASREPTGSALPPVASRSGVCSVLRHGDPREEGRHESVRCARVGPCWARSRRIVAIWIDVTSTGRDATGTEPATRLGISMLVLLILAGLGHRPRVADCRCAPLDQVWLLPGLVLGGLYLLLPARGPGARGNIGGLGEGGLAGRGRVRALRGRRDPERAPRRRPDVCPSASRAPPR